MIFWNNKTELQVPHFKGARPKLYVTFQGIEDTCQRLTFLSTLMSCAIKYRTRHSFCFCHKRSPTMRTKWLCWHFFLSNAIGQLLCRKAIKLMMSLSNFLAAHNSQSTKASSQYCAWKHPSSNSIQIESYPFTISYNRCVAGPELSYDK